jgi:hypothetical protein
VTGVRYRLAPVEALQPGDRVVLPNSKVVIVQRIDEYPNPDGDDAIYYVRWAAGPRFGHGHRLHGEPAELGSLVPMRRGDEVTVDEGWTP